MGGQRRAVEAAIMDLADDKLQKLQSQRSGALDLATHREEEEKLEDSAVVEAGGRKCSCEDGRG
jgi:hypothetical protein